MEKISFILKFILKFLYNDVDDADRRAHARIVKYNKNKTLFVFSRYSTLFAIAIYSNLCYFMLIC